jgi:hypothetical protein
MVGTRWLVLRFAERYALKDPLRREVHHVVDENEDYIHQKPTLDDLS